MRYLMSFKDITASISESESIPAGKVRRITKALLDRMGEAIDKGEKLKLPGLVFTPRTQAAREAEGDKPARPERKFATLRCRTAKEETESTEDAD